MTDRVRSPSPVTPSFTVLGVRVHAVQIPDVIARMEQWIRDGAVGRTIVVANAYTVTLAQRDPNLYRAVAAADLVVPDGMPLVWLGRWVGFPLRRRVYGPELLETFCRETGSRYRHFFYGGEPGVADRLADRLHWQYGIVIAGTFTPPFRPLSRDEWREVRDTIKRARPHVLWVGLGVPKQEVWMYTYRNDLSVAVLVGVGAAFDFLSGCKRQAPQWVRDRGLEWLFRLLTEPHRLWRRYTIEVVRFVWWVGLEQLRLRQFPLNPPQQKSGSRIPGLHDPEE